MRIRRCRGHRHCGEVFARRRRDRRDADHELRGIRHRGHTGTIAHAVTHHCQPRRQPRGARTRHCRAAVGRRAVRQIHARDEIEMPAAIRDQRRGIHLRQDVGPGDRFRIVAARSIRTQISHRRLAIDLIAKIHHRAVEGLHQVRRLRRAIRMRRVHRRRAHRVVVITPAAAVIVTAFCIQCLTRRAIRLHKAIQRIAIQRPGDGLVIAQRTAEARVQVRGCDVIMVIIRQTAVTAVVVQLADLIRHIPAVVRRVEDRDAVRRQRHRTAKEVRRRSRWIVDHDRRRRRHWHQRDAPNIRLLIPERARVVLIARRMRKVSRRDRHLLLPRRDPEHLVRHTLRRVVRFEEKGRPVPAVAHLRLERRKRSCHQQPVPRRRQRRPARHER